MLAAKLMRTTYDSADTPQSCNNRFSGHWGVVETTEHLSWYGESAVCYTDFYIYI